MTNRFTDKELNNGVAYITNGEHAEFLEEIRSMSLKDYVKKVPDRFLFFDEGKLVVKGTPEHFFTNP
jgi:ABC-type polar amino acid transport system ATPase subunit